MYKILILDFGNATFLTSDSGSSNVGEIIFEKIAKNNFVIHYSNNNYIHNWNFVRCCIKQ